MTLKYDIARHGMQDAFTLNAYRAMKMVRAQQARITELESQLAQRFDAADSVPAVEREQERIAFKDAHRHLELDEVPDAWGRPMFKHPHVEASWLGWIARASHGQAPAQATPAAVAGPKKWAPEEVEDGERGIRWVTNEGIHGRPTDHDVREYLKRTPTANGCLCDECTVFYAAAPTARPTPTHLEAMERAWLWMENQADGQSKGGHAVRSAALRLCQAHNVASLLPR